MDKIRYAVLEEKFDREILEANEEQDIAWIIERETMKHKERMAYLSKKIGLIQREKGKARAFAEKLLADGMAESIDEALAMYAAKASLKNLDYLKELPKSMSEVEFKESDPDRIARRKTMIRRDVDDCIRKKKGNDRGLDANKLAEKQTHEKFFAMVNKAKVEVNLHDEIDDRI